MKIYEQLKRLRQSQKLSQEEFASVFGVSRQAVQKWENGKSIPSIEILISISERFNVSLDELILNRTVRNTGGKAQDFSPMYNTLHEWLIYSSQLHVEYTQCIDEGIDVTEYAELFKEIEKLPLGKEKEKLADTLFEIICNSGKIKDYKYIEPNDIEQINNLKDNYSVSLTKLNKQQLKEKIKGAWYGRIAGCMLGKPLECALSYNIKYFLEQSNNYPLFRYMKSTDIKQDFIDRTGYPFPCRTFSDNIKNAPCDDDTNYTVLAQCLIETHGKEFSTEDVGNFWRAKQTQTAYCTAEAIAYRNFSLGIMPPESATYKNPFREWVGGQIRTDYYGYIAPGNPEQASYMAYKDARLSHVKNGIYGAMYVSAMLATASCTSSPMQVILSGIHQIPKTCRLYEKVTEMIEDYKNNKPFDYIINKIYSAYNEKTKHGEVHTIPNALICTASILYYGNDFSKSICSAVEAGYDTDCNGATVGSIVGMINGFNAIDKKWITPLNGKLDTSIFGMEKVNIDDLVNKTLVHISKK